MSLPTMLLGVIISSLYGSAFHLLRGGGLRRLLLYIILAWIGFWTGHIVAGLLEWTFWSIGDLHVGLATLFSLVFLGVGYWLSLVNIQPSR